MKLSEHTLEILKNFSAINASMIFRPGKTISTIAEAKNIIASATIAEDIPVQFGIYDLNELLAALTLVDDPNIEFVEDGLVIKESSSTIKYFFSSEKTITAHKKVTMPAAELKFVLTADAINRIKKAAAVLGHSTLEITGDDGEITITVVDQKNPTSNRFSLVVDKDNSCKEKFSFVIVIGLLKMIPGDYKVSVSSKLISHFEHSTAAVEYFVALEKNSWFGKQP